MSKFIVQVLLSALIGISAAVGFRQDTRGVVNKGLREAKGLLAETAEAALKTVASLKTDAEVDADVSISAEADTAASSEGSLEVEAGADAETEGDIELDAPLIENAFPETSLDASLDAFSQTGIEAETGNIGLDFEQKTKSGLDLELELEQ